MKLEGVHHVTAITADAPRNVEFYAGLLGLRLVKKTVNQDDPTVYHLFYADERGDPGSDITFFEYPGARQGRAGAGMVHTVRWRVGSEDALDFWQKRLDNHVLSREDGRLTFVDPEGLRHELAVVVTRDEPLIAEHPEVPAELALQGFDGVRAFSADPERSREFLEQTLEFDPRGEGWEARGERRGGLYEYDAAPEGPGIGGAGTVHHVAWASPPEEQEPWRERVAAAGPTRTTSSPCSTSSIRSAAWSPPRRAGRCRCRPAARTGTSSARSAFPTRRRSMRATSSRAAGWKPSPSRRACRRSRRCSAASRRAP